jgi:acyl transferase domain-containing protein/acyl carrier protein
VFGNGAGVAVLRRLDEALEADDTILAVIKGSALNNDGAAKIGYTAPSVEGQAAVITEALAVANVDPAVVGYVEAHGTGTRLGDPIEVAALSKAFAGVPAGSCALGSVKTNIGHLDAAAGIAGLVKAVQSLRAGAIPPSLHFERANPEIDFARSPFYVCTTLRDWPSGALPRRAGVSSFGVGGTNAHVVLEEAPARTPAPAAPDWHVLPISARTETALAAASLNLLDALRRLTDDDLADVAYTLQAARRRFPHRRVLVVRNRAEAIRMLDGDARGADVRAIEERLDRPVVFMFPGTGAQRAGMAKGLYESEPAFRNELDRCAELLAPLLGQDLRTILLGDAAASVPLLERTDLGQPCLFAIEYSLARCWMAWGVKPGAMIGQSLGEYVGACLAGVFSLEEALRLVVRRAQLVQSTPAGAMSVVHMPEHEIRTRIREPLALGVFVGSRLSIVTGPLAEIAAFEEALAAEQIRTHRLRTAHAFHSPLMDDVIEPLTREASQTRRHPPSIPFISNVTGTWFSPADAEDPTYWGRHLREPVRFAEGWTRLRDLSNALFLEVGPGRSLGTIVRELDQPELVYPSLSHEPHSVPDVAVMLMSLGQLWLEGAAVAWSRLDRGMRRRRLPLPTYPFERQRYWIEPETFGPASAETPLEPVRSVEQIPARQDHRTSRHPRPLLRTPFVPPATEVERVVTGIWEELLGVSPIGVNDHFFELGGSSLMMSSVVSRLEQAFPVPLPLQQVFARTSVAGLSELIEARLADKIRGLSEEEASRLLAELESSDEPLTR